MVLDSLCRFFISNKSETAILLESAITLKTYMNVSLYRYPLHHGLMNFIDTKAKCRHLKKLTCNGTLRQVFIRVYRLEIQSVMLIFSIQLCKLLPLYSSLWFNSTTLPLPCVKVQYIQTPCGWEGDGGDGG